MGDGEGVREKESDSENSKTHKYNVKRQPIKAIIKM